MFGELCALGLAERRQETVTAQEISELLSISKFDLFNTLGESAPHVLSDMRKSVVGKYNLMYRNKKRRVSFLPSVQEVFGVEGNISTPSSIASTGVLFLLFEPNMSLTFDQHTGTSTVISVTSDDESIPEEPIKSRIPGLVERSIGSGFDEERNEESTTKTF